jgi:phospholipid/cholesterol/gamma-HCH transport system ATP-binding protein
MRRFGFGSGKGEGRGEREKPSDEAPAQPDQAADAPEGPAPAPPDDGSPSDWLPRGEEPWLAREDEPAPFRDEEEVARPMSEQPAAEAGPGPQAQGEGPEAQGSEPQTDVAEGDRSQSDDVEQPRNGGAESGAPRADVPAPWEETTSTSAERAESGSRVSVVDEQPPRPAPPDGASEEEYKWHTYRVYPSGRPDAIEFIDVYKAFGRARILRGLNMGLPEGMVSMILGPSGTGKSVCIKHMVGLLYPDEGDVLVHGDSVVNMADDDLFEMRKKFGLLFQDGALFGSMNLFDNVAFPLRQHTEKGEDEIEDIVMRRLNEVGLGQSREKMPNELSGGMRKRAGFARALVLEPDIVLFDEPDSGLDPVRTALLGELILEIHRDMMDEAKQKQKQHLPTFCVITHDIMSARRVADYINVLWKGRIVEAGPAEDMLNSENPFIRQFLSGESQGPLTMD